MKICKLVERLQVRILQGDAETDVTSVVYDSRKVTEGCPQTGNSLPMSAFWRLRTRGTGWPWFRQPGSAILPKRSL